MFPADFAYVRAESLADALELLARASAGGEDAKLLAGGQSLLPLMKLRLAAPETLIDIGALTGLAGITHGPGASTASTIAAGTMTAAGTTTVGAATTTVGAATTYRTLQRDPEMTARFPGIADALDVLADQQVRARGTIGGCVAHGDPAADLPAVLLALDAAVTIAGPAGTRVTPLDDFLQGVFTTDLAPDEIITAITLPAAPPGQAYEKFEQPASHLPLAGVCAVLEVNDGAVTSVRVAVTGIAPRPFRALSAERSLLSAPLTPSALDAAAATVDTGGGQSLSDQHASGPYRRHLARVLARRALARAAERATSPREPAR
ncbi:MAG TPA: FAD binding domain-containing protein [Trebonia sp.]|nr:FAD binding domain-containing protein [Trebonia sp.]